jgi:hypothetical protein
MKRFWDPGIERTLLFTLAIFTFVIATYQTLTEGNMDGLYHNYWLYMISFGAIIYYRYLKQRHKEATAETEAAAKAAAAAQAKPKGKNKKH